MSNDNLGDRMKGYEAIETERRFDPRLPVYARIDGRGFSRFTKGLRRPFDERMSNAMIETTRHLVAGTNAKIGYTQSDEISLVWILPSDNELTQMMFDGKVQKLCSVLAAMATAAFTQEVILSDAEFCTYARKLPHFDARVFQLPSIEEAANAILWRELDAMRNAVSMTAHHMFSHKSLQGVSTGEMRQRIAEAGVDFQSYPTFFRRGTYLARRAVPQEHDGVVLSRRKVLSLDLPPLLEIANRPDVLFFEAEPAFRQPVAA